MKQILYEVPSLWVFSIDPNGCLCGSPTFETSQYDEDSFENVEL